VRNLNGPKLVGEGFVGGEVVDAEITVFESDEGQIVFGFEVELGDLFSGWVGEPELFWLLAAEVLYCYAALFSQEVCALVVLVHSDGCWFWALLTADSDIPAFLGVEEGSLGD
jgi:hypothetical protein